MIEPPAVGVLAMLGRGLGWKKMLYDSILASGTLSCENLFAKVVLCRHRRPTKISVF